MKTNSLIILGVGAAFSVGKPALASETLTISYWGGNSAERFEEYVVKPFEEAYGVDVLLDTGAASQRLSKLIASDGRGVDLFYITDSQMILAERAGLLKPIVDGSLSNLPSVYGGFRDPIGAGCPAYTVLAAALVYNPAEIAAPTSWLDMQKAAEAGKLIAMPSLSVSFGPMFLTALAEVNGGGIDDVDPAFTVMKTLADQVQYFTQSGATVQMIAQGELAMAPLLNIFVKKTADSPVQMAFPDEGAIGVLNMACVVAGTEKSDLAQKFVDFHLSPEIQTAMMVNVGETPVNTTVALPDDLTFNVLTPAQIEKLQLWNPGVIADQSAEWLTRFQNEIAAQ